MSDRVELSLPDGTEEGAGADALEQLLARDGEQREPAGTTRGFEGTRVGRLIGFRGTYEPLVTYPGQPGSAALGARAAVDLCPEHIGQEVVLVFEDGDPRRPLVAGRVRIPAPWPQPDRPLQVEVDADGQRLTLTAREQLVLRCGKASVTLTAAGKILIEGAYVSNRSSGVMRIKGGSVQIN